jgi:hypothetical protein
MTKKTREILYKIGLMIFGLTLLPGMIFFIKAIFVISPITLSDFYSSFYGSLLDMGKDGLIVWGIACSPYLAYEVYLLLTGFTTKRDLTAQGEIEH